MKSQLLYKDHTVFITDTYITIYNYYFPLATSKTIMFNEIEKVSI